MKKIVATFIIVSISIGSLHAQNKTIKGRITSEFFETMAGVSILMNDTIELGRTDLNGVFQIDNIPVSVNKILFRVVGLEPANIELADTCNEVEVIMMASFTYDFKALKKVDRLRMKRFKKLPELHREAFEKGLFKTDKACYAQAFIPNYKKRKN